MDTTKTPSQKQQSPVVTTAAIVNLFASGDPQAPYKMRDIYEAELQALRDRVEVLEKAGKVMERALIDELAALEVGDQEIGPQKYSDDAAAIQIIDAIGAWQALFMPNNP